MGTERSGKIKPETVLNSLRHSFKGLKNTGMMSENKYRPTVNPYLKPVLSMKIYLKDAIRTLQLASGQQKTFAITYWKKDGSYGSKDECRNRSGWYSQKKKSDLASIKNENRKAGKAYLEYRTGSGNWQAFEVFWCLMESFDGRIIDHRF